MQATTASTYHSEAGRKIKTHGKPTRLVASHPEPASSHAALTTSDSCSSPKSWPIRRCSTVPVWKEAETGLMPTTRRNQTVGLLLPPLESWGATAPTTIAAQDTIITR